MQYPEEAKGAIATRYKTWAPNSTRTLEE